MNDDASAIQVVTRRRPPPGPGRQTSITGFCDSASCGPAPFSALLPHLRPLLHWGPGVCGILGVCPSQASGFTLLFQEAFSRRHPLPARPPVKRPQLSRPISETQSGPAALLAGLGFTCPPHLGTSCVTPGEWPLRVGPLTGSALLLPQNGRKQCSPPFLEAGGSPNFTVE